MRSCSRCGFAGDELWPQAAPGSATAASAAMTPSARINF
jgi:hypothetical protein